MLKNMLKNLKSHPLFNFSHPPFYMDEQNCLHELRDEKDINLGFGEKVKQKVYGKECIGRIWLERGEQNYIYYINEDGKEMRWLLLE